MKVFADKYSDKYDKLYCDKNYIVECDLIEEAIRRYSTNKPKSIVDIGCGTGGHAIELSKRGYILTGIDLSMSMLDIANSKSGELSEKMRPNWIQGGASNFQTKYYYDMAIMMFAVIGYITENNEIIKALKNIRNHLNSGSIFISDFWYGPAVLAKNPSDRIKIFDDEYLKIIRTSSTKLNIEKHTAEVFFNLLTLENKVLIDQTSETHCLRYFFPQEFSMMLTMSGFEVISLSTFPSLDDTLNSETLSALAVARAI